MTDTQEKRDQRPLSPVSRRALEDQAYQLHVEQMRTYGEVAEKMGCSRRTAIRRVARAEGRMARLLQSTIAQMRARQERRYEALLSRLAREWTGPLTEKQAATMASVIAKIDRLWGLDRSAPAEHSPTVIAQHATIAPLDASAVRALLGRDPIPLPGRAPITVETPLLVENDAPVASADTKALPPQ
jgi:hypothetical protein